MSETNQEREIRKLREEVYSLTKVLRKLTGVIEKTIEPEQTRYANGQTFKTIQEE